ncbi:chondroitin sulfate proteoglycan 4-like [Lampetra planeri]
MGPGSPPPLLLLLLLMLCASVAVSLQASFYGASYVELPLADATNNNEIYIRFKTARRNGLLLAIGGQTDYILVELRSARLQVRMDLGSGEVILLSQPGLRLNNFLWHDLQLTQERERLVLTIDELFPLSLRLPGTRFELNVHHGVFLGGGAARLEQHPYMAGVSPGFRGCISDAVYNQHDLLSVLAGEAEETDLVHEVTQGCSDEFSAFEEDPIHFLNPRSYVAFDTWSAREVGVFECVLQTVHPQGVLLYHSNRQTDFIAMEIVDGYVQALIDKGNRIRKVTSSVKVDDGQWYKIKLNLTIAELQLTVGAETVKTSLGHKRKYLDLTGLMFVGGVEDINMEEILTRGIVSLSRPGGHGSSFQGCMRDVRINLQKQSLQDALVTREISITCGEELDEEDLSIDTPDLLLISPSPAATLHGNDDDNEDDEVDEINEMQNSDAIIVFQTLVVQEGGENILNPENINITVDLNNVGLRQSQILFRITKEPRHGLLKLDIPGANERRAFTLLDIGHRRVIYVHDGSESHSDRFKFRILIHNKKELPMLTTKEKEYTFRISIMPVNDPPKLNFPNGDLFMLLENTRRQITENIMEVSDVDSDASNSFIHVTDGLSSSTGFFSYRDSPRINITTFRYSEVQKGVVYYAHRGERSTRLELQASDRDRRRGKPIWLRVMAVPVELSVVNNTGLLVSQGDAAVLTAANLSVHTNADKQLVDIWFTVTEGCRYGRLQKRYLGGEWRPSHNFTQHDLQQAQIRYESTDTSYHFQNITDSFKFTVTIGEFTTDEHEFILNISCGTIKLIRHETLTIASDRRGDITNDHVLAAVGDGRPPASLLVYTVLTLPTRGRLRSSRNGLELDSTFTQLDVELNRVSYELFGRARSDQEDSFQFKVSAGHSRSPRYTFRIKIERDPLSVILTNVGLSVEEGRSVPITSQGLFARSKVTDVYRFHVVDGPHHGALLRNDTAASTGLENVTHFTNQDILNKWVVYVHDDSETEKDQFVIVASPMGNKRVSDALLVYNDSDVAQLRSEVDINVRPINDQRPVRVVDKAFHVVRGGKRLLTTADVCYHDPDWDFQDSNLVYKQQSTFSGQLVSANDSAHNLTEFKQQDLENGLVLFIHHGGDASHLALMVSDGLHRVSGLLEIRASEAFLRVMSPISVLVTQGQSCTLTALHLGVFTNLDIRHENEIQYRVATPPMHGQLIIGEVASDFFTQSDVTQGRVVYEHANGSVPRDAIGLHVAAHGLETRAELAVRVRLAAHGTAPVLVHNSSSGGGVLVERGGAVRITDSALLVSHEASLPSEITFTVIRPPKHGFLKKRDVTVPKSPTRKAEGLVSFTQQEINEEMIEYLHTELPATEDSFTVDSSNGFMELRGVDMCISVIPSEIELTIQNLTVAEGGLAVLTQDDISSTNPLFDRLRLHYVIVEQPKHGHIQNARKPDMRLAGFYGWEVAQGLMEYAHDGSETAGDSLVLMANDSHLHKHSRPLTLPILVVPVNDEAPAIIVNNVLKVWFGSVTPITTAELSAQDLDSLPEDVLFTISPPSSGYVALAALPSRPVLNFTQADVLRGRVLYAHRDSMEVEFTFHVSDGQHRSPTEVFLISAQRLLITLHGSRVLQLYPGATRTIGSQELRASTNDEDPLRHHRVLYSISRGPQMGALVRADAPHNPIYNFTQEEVDSGLVAYKHGGFSEPGWEAEDDFEFTALSPPARPEKQNFHFSISYRHTDSEHRSRLLANTGANVTQGGSVTIDKTNLDASNVLTKFPPDERLDYEVTFYVTRLPEFGQLSVGARNISQSRPSFSQLDIERRGLRYTQDTRALLGDGGAAASLNFKRKEPGAVAFRGTARIAGDSAANTGSDLRHAKMHKEMELKFWTDSFNFSVRLTPRDDQAKESEDISVIAGETFIVRIFPLNIHPPVFQMQQPTLQVVLGQATLITSSHLLTTDKDNHVQDLVYTLITPPTNGWLAFADNATASVQQFTQEDIDTMQLVFVQSGGLRSSGGFDVSISDGKHPPLTQRIVVEVVLPSISLSNNTNITILQGQTSVNITNAMLAAVTNVRNVALRYHITKPPTHGILMKRGKSIDAFEQEDIDEMHLMYTMVDITSPNDSFVFDVHSHNVSIFGQAVNILVNPLVKIGQRLQISPGSEVQLGEDHLDCSPLALLTQSSPTFRIIKHPQHGQLLWKNTTLRAPRETDISPVAPGDRRARSRTAGTRMNKRAEQVSTFTQDDLHRGRVFLKVAESNAILIDNLTVDHFQYELSAQGVQPAIGQFVYEILFPNRDPFSSVPTAQMFFPFNDSNSAEINITHLVEGYIMNGVATEQDLTMPTFSVDLENPVPGTFHNYYGISEKTLYYIILPTLIVIAMLVIAIIVMITYKKKRAKGLGQNFSCGFKVGRMERSPAVPSVTVTPLDPGPAEVYLYEPVPDSCIDDAALRAHSPKATQGPAPGDDDSPEDGDTDISAAPCDWSLMDPELLQHYRTSSPVLKENQYWV